MAKRLFGSPEEYDTYCAGLSKFERDDSALTGPEKEWTDGGFFAGGRVRRKVSGKDSRVEVDLPDGGGKLTIYSTRGNWDEDTPLVMKLEHNGVVKKARLIGGAHRDFQIVNEGGESGGNVFLQGAARSELALRVAKSIYNDPSLSEVNADCGTVPIKHWMDRAKSSR